MSEAVFMGGPADGRLYAFPGEEPPPFVELHSMGETRGLAPDDPVPTITHRYRREVSQMDDGPLWVLVYEEQG